MADAERNREQLETLYRFHRKMLTHFSVEDVLAYEGNRADLVPYAMLRVAGVFEVLRAQVRRSHPATPQERLVIGSLWEAGPLSVSDIARRADVSRSTASETVERLAQRGFVERTHDPADRRRVLVELTDQGLGSLEPLLFDSVLHIANGFAGLEPERVDAALSSLQALHAIVGELATRFSAMDEDELREYCSTLKERQAELDASLS